MLGAIAGDIIGSIYEHSPIKSKDFPLFQDHNCFTDDTVLTFAIADSILNDTSYQYSLKKFGLKYPKAGYGARFNQWLHSHEARAYNSWGNGSAMRVSPIGFAFSTEETVLLEAKKSAEVTHNHREGIKGAQATALAVHLAWKGADKSDIREQISRRFKYQLHRTVEDIRPSYSFKISCQETVPEAIIAFLDSKNFEDTIRNAVSLGGDSDTLACIAGGIAGAYYRDIPFGISDKVLSLLPANLLKILKKFQRTYLH